MFLFKFLSRFGVRLYMGITEEETGGGLGGGGGGNLPSNDNLSGGSNQGGLGGVASNPWDAVPKSWAQEVHSHWNDVKPEVRQYIHKREADVERGIRSYSDGHQRWSRLQGVWGDYAQDPNFDATGVYETLANNHLALVRATPEQRTELFKELAKAYGLTLGEVRAVAAAANTGGQQGQTAESDIDRLLEAKMGKYLAPVAQFMQGQQTERVAASVDAFFSDPKNEFANELAPDILQLINSGEARNLKAAYDLALIRNPVVQAKYVAKLAGGAAGGQQGAQGASGERNLKSSGEGAPPGKAKSMDDTMEAIVSKHYGARNVR
jgi:hypothetical protein